MFDGPQHDRVQVNIFIYPCMLRISRLHSVFQNIHTESASCFFHVWRGLDLIVQWPWKHTLACYATFVSSYVCQNIHRKCCVQCFSTTMTLKTYFSYTTFVLTYCDSKYSQGTHHDMLNITTHCCTPLSSTAPPQCWRGCSPHSMFDGTQQCSVSGIIFYYKLQVV